jgi:polar amino acid transport system substrate-binding protein
MKFRLKPVFVLFTLVGTMGGGLSAANANTLAQVMEQKVLRECATLRNDR